MQKDTVLYCNYDFNDFFFEDLRHVFWCVCARESVCVSVCVWRVCGGDVEYNVCTVSTCMHLHT